MWREKSDLGKEGVEGVEGVAEGAGRVGREGRGGVEKGKKTTQFLLLSWYTSIHIECRVSRLYFVLVCVEWESR